MRFPLIDGFDHYPAVLNAGGVSTVWNGVGPLFGSTIAVVAPGLGGEGQCLSFGSNTNIQRIQWAFEEVAKITLHFAIKFTSRDGASSSDLVRMKTALGAAQWSLALDAAGHLQLKGEAGAVLGASTTVFATNQIYRICLSADMSGTGSFRLSVNGTDDAGLHLDAIDIEDADLAVMGLLEFSMAHTGLGGSIGFLLDDVILGIDECVDWGPQEVNTLPVSLDLAVEWTRSAGATNFSNVDELPTTLDTDYNSSAVAGQKDVFSFGNPPHTPEVILALQIMTIARKEESAVRKLREFVRIAAIDYPGTEHNLAETYGRWVSTWVLNPATGLPWSAAALNAIQGGYELTVAA